MNWKRWWGARSFAARLGTLACGAALCALTLEGLSNLPALQTRALTPSPVPLSAFSVEAPGVAVERHDDGIDVENAANCAIDLILQSPDCTLKTVSVTLAGEGVVNASVLLTDEACAETPSQVYSIACVAGDPVLGSFCVPAQSAGIAGEVRVRLIPQSADLFSVTGITLNAPIPFRWQPLRMALGFSVALALLCALFLRGMDAAYNPARRSHRLIVALPLVGLMGFSLALAGWIAPDQPLFQGVTDAQAATGEDTYAVLFETLRQGRLSVNRTPDPALAALTNPYDQSARIAAGIQFPFDYAYHGGQYYIYYGLAPVLTVYAPYRWLTGTVPTSRDATLTMAWLTIALVGYAVCGLAKRYAKGVNVFALSLCCVTAVFASGALLLLSSADFYYLAELSFVCFGAGSVGFGLHAAEQPRRGLRAAQYALSGVCFALSAMSRPSALPMLIAFLTPLYLCELARRRAGPREAAAFLVPAMLGIGFLLWYNAARFGSAFNFGAAEQLTVTDMHWQRVRPAEWAQALYHYLLEPLGWSNRFPYVALSYHALPAVGRTVFTLSNVGLLADPFFWGIAFFPLAAARFPAGSPLLRREERATTLLPLLVSLPMMVVCYGLAGAILRYTCDFRIFFTLAGALCAMRMMTGADTSERRAFLWICALLCVGSIFINFGLLFDNERDNILKYSPQIYYGMQRMFFPY